MSNPATKKGSSGRWQVGLIGLVFLIPILLAFLWRPTGYVNHGELVAPARAIEDVALIKLDGTPFRFSQLQRKWTLLYVGGRQCAAQCEQNLYKIQQVRLAQSKNAYRVQSVYVTRVEEGDRMQDMLEQYPGLIGLQAEHTVFERLAKQFKVKDQTPLDGAQRIYIVDPLGNLMLSYPPDADPSGIRKDLNRLLRVSQIG